MKRIIVATFLVSIVAVACSPKVKPAATAPAEAAMPATPSSLAADIEAGHTIFTTNCTKCHGAKTKYVDNHTYEQSIPVMTSMSKKAKLSPDQIKQLAAYVYSAAKK